MKINTHLMLVSGQPTPNLTPALDPVTAPQRIILLVSPDMHRYADWLTEIYQPRGLKIERWLVDNSWDSEHIQSRLLELLECETQEGRDLALNATGGTKVMSIAAYEAFRAYGLPVYYVHPERDLLMWMHPQKRPPHQLADRIRIADFIKAHGGQVISRGDIQVPPAYREFAQQLIDEIDYYSDALGVLNWYANSAERDLRSEKLEARHLRFSALQDLVDKLDSLGVLRLRDKYLVFSDEKARFFANGGWLEQYVFASLNGLKTQLPAIQDTAQGVEIIHAGGSKNELDVVFLADNHLYLIECKAKTFKRDDTVSGANTLYKLDSLADTLGGLQARAMLISYKELSPFDAQRARDLRIAMLHGRQLQSLQTHLHHWIQSG